MFIPLNFQKTIANYLSHFLVRVAFLIQEIICGHLILFSGFKIIAPAAAGNDFLLGKHVVFELFIKTCACKNIFVCLLVAKKDAQDLRLGEYDALNKTA